MTSPAKLPFLRRMIRHRLTRRGPTCPYCEETGRLKRIARKKLVLDVLQCEQCLLMFRWPMETAEEFKRFYQQDYTEGAITKLPQPDELARLCAAKFRGSTLDLDGKVQLLRALEPAGRVLDYGCSWGYGVQQLREAGFDAVGFEVSGPRAAYGRAELGVEILDTPQALEHLPSDSFDEFFRLLRTGGLLFLVLPNFNGTAARNGQFLSWIGEAHPVAPTREFFRRNLPAHGFETVHCASGPFTERAAELAARGRFDELETDGDELLVLARKA